MDPPTEDDEIPDETLEILYLLDRFGISDQFYHELSMVNPSLPRSYVVKQARESISSIVVINRLPKPYTGCYRPFEDCLRNTISAEVNTCMYTCNYR